MATFYDQVVPMADGTELSMADMKGKVVIVVNTATGCGFTPDYEPLEELYEEFHERGLRSLMFPATSSQARHRNPMKRFMSSASLSITPASLR